MQELGKHGLPILVHCVSCGYEAIQMLEKCDYDAVVLKPTVRLSQTEEIDSLDFLRMIAHIAECAEESLCQTLVVEFQRFPVFTKQLKSQPLSVGANE